MCHLVNCLLLLGFNEISREILRLGTISTCIGKLGRSVCRSLLKEGSLRRILLLSMASGGYGFQRMGVTWSSSSSSCPVVYFGNIWNTTHQPIVVWLAKLLSCGFKNNEMWIL